MTKQVDNTEEKLHTVEEVLTRSEIFLEKNQKLLAIILGAAIVVVLGFFAFQKFYKAPREKSAQADMFMAQKYFEQDSLKQALNGDGTNLGFLSVIDEYGSTQSGNLAKYYAGISYLKLGKYQEAIDFLKKFKSDDEFVGPLAIGGIGDAYLELGQKDKAVEYYEKAANQKANNLTSPLYLMRAAMTYEDLGKFDKAVNLYEKIKKEYFKSNEAQDIDKNIEMVKSKLGKN